MSSYRPDEGCYDLSTDYKPFFLTRNVRPRLKEAWFRAICAGNGETVKFGKFKGKVFNGVNVASKCGYTPGSYTLLSKVSKIPGVEVALFPCNQFLGQKPGNDADAASFCVLKGKGVPVIRCFCLPMFCRIISN